MNQTSTQEGRTQLSKLELGEVPAEAELVSSKVISVGWISGARLDQNKLSECLVEEINNSKPEEANAYLVGENRVFSNPTTFNYSWPVVYFKIPETGQGEE